MILIKQGKIVDGTGRKPYLGDILIDGGKIAEISPHIQETDNMRVILADGKTVTPGFIDAHRHWDFSALYDPDFGILELMQGITTSAAGNCGLAAAPSPLPCAQTEMDRLLLPCLGEGRGEVFKSTAEYICTLKNKKLPISTEVLCATGAVTAFIKGFSPDLFTRRQLEQAESEIRSAMEAGARGLSCGIMYPPECHTAKYEFIRMCRAVRAYNGYLTAHIRNEGGKLLESIKEVAQIAKMAEIPLNISHFKITGIKNWDTGLYRAIDEIESIRAKGFPITVDAYPYTAGSTTALSLLPPGILDGRETNFLGTHEGQALFKRAMDMTYSGWENMIKSIGMSRIVISCAVKTPEFTGMSFAEAADSVGRDEYEFFCEIISSNGGGVGIIVNSMSQRDVDTVLTLPYCSLISDALYGPSDFPHPRLYGAFPKFIREYVRERRILSIEAAVMKMTSMPAKRLGITDRGYLKKGKRADILLFDLEEITDMATYENPKQLSQGISMQIVGGIPLDMTPFSLK